ncbi:MAG: phytanoyl-CoA dioxygenase family protein [Armatimonadetes bacterium]|nr:phytanoyl-CoA dioxygenase family protein [Armatimonadota bacterium]
MAAVGLPDLSSEFALAPGMPEQFQRDGFVFLDQLCPQQELAPYTAVIEEVTMREAGELMPMAERGTYAKAFIQIGNLWRKDERVARFVLARRFGKVAADLLGVEGVRLYHDQALFKEPGGGPTPWHQDQFYWPLEGVKTITMWMPLVDVPPEMMGMTFAKASHLEGAYTSMAISDESNRFYRDLIEEKGFEIVQIAGMKAGDANFHAGWIIHGAPGNATDQMRAAMTVIYFEDGARISKPDHENRQHDMETWFPGQQPGEVAASPLNPLVYNRHE